MSWKFQSILSDQEEEYYTFDACDRMDLFQRGDRTASIILKARSQLTVRPDPQVGTYIGMTYSTQSFQTG